MHGDLVESAKITVGAGFYPARAVQYRGCGRTNANTFPVCRGRCRALPARSTSVLTIRCGKFAIAPRADRVVRPYRALCIFADGAYNFVIAPRRVDVGIDPYGDFAWSPVVVRVCFCILRGRGRTPPLRRFGRSCDIAGVRVSLGDTPIHRKHRQVHCQQQDDRNDRQGDGDGGL